jgi:hypothetical protein
MGDRFERFEVTHPEQRLHVLGLVDMLLASAPAT